MKHLIEKLFKWMGNEVVEMEEKVLEDQNKIENGQGTFTSSGGNKYVGEFKDGKENGQGTYTWTDGDKYVGEWKDGKRTGQGTFTSSGGNKYVGEFKYGKKWSGTYYNADGSIRGRFTEGKWKKL